MDFKKTGIPMLEYQLLRVHQAKTINKIVIATGEGPENDPIEKLCKKMRVSCFRGQEDDVLDRFHQCSLAFPGYDTIVRLTADCPVIDPGVIDHTVTFFLNNKLEYTSNVPEKKETLTSFLLCFLLSTAAGHLCA